MKAYSPPSGQATGTIIWFYFLDLYSVVWFNHTNFTLSH